MSSQVVYVISFGNMSCRCGQPSRLSNDVFATLESALTALNFWIAVKLHQVEPWARTQVEESLSKWVQGLVDNTTPNSFSHISQILYGAPETDLIFCLDIIAPTSITYPKFKDFENRKG